MRILNDILNQAQPFEMWDNAIALCYRGSIAHNTHLREDSPSSVDDKDVIGIAVPPKKLVDKFGYDCKNAQHLVRLLRQGLEFLRTGELQVERLDRAELIQIKTGQWSIEKVKRTASELFKAMERARDESKLPEEPDFDAIDRLTSEILIEHFSK